MLNMCDTRKKMTGKEAKMDTEQLKNYLAVAQLGSFQKVADQRFISQRTVSKQMANLEDELGVQLFFRGPNKVTLTNAGNYFVQRATELLNQLDDSIVKLHSISQQSFQHLHIGYFSPFEGRLLVNHIHAYQDTANLPIRFHVSEAGIEHLIADITMGTLDCAYILDYGTHEHLIHAELSSTPIASGEMVLGLSRRNPIISKNFLTDQDLTARPILYYSNESSTYLQAAFLATLKSSNPECQVQRVGTFEQMQALVSLDQAMAFYPHGLPLFPNDEIVYRRLKSNGSFDSQHYTVQLVARIDNNVNGLTAYRDFLTKHKN